MSELEFFIGWDSKQPLIAAVCKASLMQWIPETHVHELKLSQLQSIYTRPHDDNQATEFSFSRFLIPYLMNYQGWAVFCDGDFLWTADPHSLAKFANKNYAVSVVQHKITSAQLTSIKMDNRPQRWYPRKNWSSLMLINCAHPQCRQLSPDVVNNASAAYLHQLEWADDCIGALPLEYNFLVGYYPPQDSVCAYHFTDGTPLHPGYENAPFSDLWWQVYNKTSCC